MSQTSKCFSEVSLLKNKTPYVNKMPFRPHPPNKSRSGSGRRVGRHRPSNYRKRTAYAPSSKRQMGKRRQPFVESKTRTSEDVYAKLKDSGTPNGGIPIDTMALEYIPVDDAYTGLQLSPLTYMTQGTEEDDMIGRAIFAKYLKTKIQITWPANTYLNPAELFLVHGFIKISPNLTSFTDPTVQSFTWDMFREFTRQRLKDYFDEHSDKLRFIPKQNSAIQIKGYKKLRPNINKQFSLPAQLNPDTTSQDKILGSIPDTYTSFSHTMMRKIHYEKGNNNTLKEFYYINSNQWIPFACLYNPDFANNNNASDADRIQVRTNTILYYSDS